MNRRMKIVGLISFAAFAALSALIFIPNKYGITPREEEEGDR